MKKLLLLSALAISLNTIAQIPTNGLIAYYPFNGNANDVSGSGNNGTVYGCTLVADRFGNPNSAYSFDGISDSIIVPNSSNLQFAADNQSISFWMKVPSLPNPTINNEGIFDKFNENLGIDPSGNSAQGFYVVFGQSGNGTMDYSIKSGSSSSWATATTNSSLLTANQWEHIVYVFNSTKDSVYSYLNGALVNKSLIPSGTVIGQNTLPLLIGKSRWTSNGNPSYLFTGTLDDIRIYNVALDSANINALYNEGLCYQSITVTDTLIINANITGFNPITYNNTIKVYPNPTNTEITIDAGTTGVNTGYTIKILNTLSQVVYQQTINTQTYTVNLSTFGGAGVYFVQLYNPNGGLIDVRKIVLE